MMMELSGHKKTPVPNRGFVPGRSEVVQPLWSRDHKYTSVFWKLYRNSKKFNKNLQNERKYELEP